MMFCNLPARLWQRMRKVTDRSLTTPKGLSTHEHPEKRWREIVTVDGFAEVPKSNRKERKDLPVSDRK
jgi:hypothetical protein